MVSFVNGSTNPRTGKLIRFQMLMEQHLNTAHLPIRLSFIIYNGLYSTNASIAS